MLGSPAPRTTFRTCFLIDGSVVPTSQVLNSLRTLRGSWHACLPIMAREPPGKRHRSPLGARTSERQSDSQLSA